MAEIPRDFFYKMVDCLNRGLTVEQAKKELGLDQPRIIPRNILIDNFNKVQNRN